MDRAASDPGFNSRLAWAGYVLGFSLGGFFDGIMLHQVLQWHHLLSLVPGESLRSIEAQTLWDGLFHILHYLIALVGLRMLWGARDQLGAAESGRRLLSTLLIGFAVWNTLDVVGFHWGLGIHRIRVDVPVEDRLSWDLLWWGLFSGLPLIGAWLAERGGRGGGGRGRMAATAAAALVVCGGALSLRTPSDAPGRAVLFREGVTPAQAMAAVAAVDGRVLWMSADGRLAGVALPKGAGGWRLYAYGALVVGGPGSPAACLSWSKV